MIGFGFHRPAGASGRHRRGTVRAGRRWRHGSEARARKSWGEAQGAGPPAMMIRNPDQPGPDSPDPAAAAVTVSNVGGRAGQQVSRPQGGGCRELSTSLPWFATLHWHFEVRTRVRLRGLRTHCVRTARPSRHCALMTTLCSQLFLVFLYLLQYLMNSAEIDDDKMKIINIAISTKYKINYRIDNKKQTTKQSKLNYRTAKYNTEVYVKK